MSTPIVALVGRPNVGKSSLFNRFLKRPVAIVDEQPGVTRDRNYALCDWNGVAFHLVDTGGIVPQADEMMEQSISEQAEFAIAEADVILLIVDVQVGVDSYDMAIAKRLRKSGKECVLVVNKVDSSKLEPDIYEFHKLGLGELCPVSATTGQRIGDLLDIIVQKLPEQPALNEQEKDVIRVAVVGRPNVGKSSFINKLTGQDRLIVTPIAGTTRDAVDTLFEYDGQKYILVDTAGLRRKYKVYENIEFYTSLRTVRAIENCDVAVVLIDASEGITSQDQRVLDEVVSTRRAAVLAVNKWDLVEKDSNTADEYTRAIHTTLAKYSYLPIIYVSAMSGKRVAKVLSLVKQVHEENNKRIPTSELNDFLQRTIARQHPPARQRKYIKFNYVTQTEIAPPTFVFFCNHPKLLEKSYISYLSNQLRETFGFQGVSIRLKFKRK